MFTKRGLWIAKIASWLCIAMGVFTLQLNTLEEEGSYWWLVLWIPLIAINLKNVIYFDRQLEGKVSDKLIKLEDERYILLQRRNEVLQQLIDQQERHLSYRNN